jgi:uncharacterized protein YndB with AHSA1/START domain
MSVTTDASGRRTLQLEVAVPGTPDQVWQAIATGAGISSWFVPTDVAEREGGAIAFHLGPDMESSGHVTAWEPPRRFAYEEPDWAPNAPPLATEFTIHVRSGGTCTVRLVHSLFASGDEWDDQLESFESGWSAFFEILRLYLSDFASKPCSTIRVTGTVDGTELEAWDALTRAIGLPHAVKGQRPARPSAGLPPFNGAVHRVGGKAQRDMLVKLEQPAEGAGLFGVYTWGNHVTVSITLYLFGGETGVVAARDEPLWRAWMDQRLLAARIS